MSTVSDNIKFLRKEADYTQQTFADALGIKRSLVGAYEEGRADPRISNLIKISELFSIRICIVHAKAQVMLGGGPVHTITAKPPVRQRNHKVRGVDGIHKISAEIFQWKIVVVRQRKQLACLKAEAVIEFLLDPELPDGRIHFTESHCAGIKGPRLGKKSHGWDVRSKIAIEEFEARGCRRCRIAAGEGPGTIHDQFIASGAVLGTHAVCGFLVDVGRRYIWSETVLFRETGSQFLPGAERGVYHRDL